MKRQKTLDKRNELAKKYEMDAKRGGSNKIRPVRAKDLEDFTQLNRQSSSKKKSKGSESGLSFEKSIEINSAYVVEKRSNDHVSKELELVDQSV